MLRARRRGEVTPPLYYVVGLAVEPAVGTGEVGLDRCPWSPARRPCRDALHRRAPRGASGSPCGGARRVAIRSSSGSGRRRGPTRFSCRRRRLGCCSSSAPHRAPTGRNLGAWAAVSALALATHYFAVFVVVPPAVWLVLAVPSERRRRRDRRDRRAGRRWARRSCPCSCTRRRVDPDTGGLGGTSLEHPNRRRAEELPGRLSAPGRAPALGRDGPARARARRVLAAPSARPERRTAVIERSAGRRGPSRRTVPARRAPARTMSPAGTCSLRCSPHSWSSPWGARASRAGMAAGIALCTNVARRSSVWMERRPRYQRKDWRGAARALGPARADRLLDVLARLRQPRARFGSTSRAAR